MAQSKVTLSDFLSILLQYYVHVLANFRDCHILSYRKKLYMPAAGRHVLREENSEFLCIFDYQMANWDILCCL